MLEIVETSFSIKRAASMMPQGRALKELSPEDVTKNVYMMVDVLLHNIHVQLQHGHSLQVFVYCSKKCFESEPNCESWVKLLVHPRF